MLNVRSSRSVFWNIFLKFSGKHLWCSPNISKIFNRPPENWFNNRQYTTHIEQLLDALRKFMYLYFLYQNGLSTISINPWNFWLHITALLGKPLIKHSWVFFRRLLKQIKKPRKTSKKKTRKKIKIYYQTWQNFFLLIWTRNKLW